MSDGNELRRDDDQKQEQQEESFLYNFGRLEMVH